MTTVRNTEPAISMSVIGECSFLLVNVMLLLMNLQFQRNFVFLGCLMMVDGLNQFTETDHRLIDDDNNQ